jgi:hypothetical protein
MAKSVLIKRVRSFLGFGQFLHEVHKEIFRIGKIVHRPIEEKGILWVEGRTTKCIQLVEGEVIVNTGVAIPRFCEAIQGAQMEMAL